MSEDVRNMASISIQVSRGQNLVCVVHHHIFSIYNSAWQIINTQNTSWISTWVSDSVRLTPVDQATTLIFTRPEKGLFPFSINDNDCSLVCLQIQIWPLAPGTSSSSIGLSHTHMHRVSLNSAERAFLWASKVSLLMCHSLTVKQKLGCLSNLKNTFRKI